MEIRTYCLRQQYVHMRFADDLLNTKGMEGFMAEDKKKEIDVAVIEVTEEYLKEKLYKIRGKRVLLDADLAEIYGYDTKGFNRQVKNNIEKFDEDFMFELTDEELEDLRYKNCTANISSKSRYNPHVFTEQISYNDNERTIMHEPNTVVRR